MKKSFKTTMLGVTLLEIMLVLAIAGVIIAMSVRYFQSASANQRMTSALANVQAVVGAVESYRMAGNDITQVAAADALTPYLPGGKMPTSPWDNKPLTITAPTSSSYTINMDIANSGTAPTACAQFATKIAANGPYTATCSGEAIAIVVATS